ncbi:hypothetical protein AUEXF2481DRAFT_24506 [Aureobasidium subglaciale EXF-2481]|uniref:BTB domain-containing protein n=1 Tax=Aureobasidium subglaciale (strain EXF-2481) TaxID=1043005 RepID=A0A074Z1G8_AURSE|nr:uncharacterized protein AUEXF2481DRAFT_24506 [Aureobasidium subglaciale EXF-2481]KER00153.1 hypothetical protein AUEXF2481DRAFT_24506 [Aureobasidium subglaciale EXF-2481]
MAPKTVSRVRELPPKSCFRGETVYLLVGMGSEQEIFTEYKNILCFYFPGYFQGALSGAFSEASMDPLSMNAIDIRLYETVHYFLQRGQLSEDSDLSWEDLFRIWLFGDQHIIPALQNEVMDVLIAKFDTDRKVPAKCIPLIYSNALSEAHLRTLLVDWTLRTGLLYYEPVATDLVNEQPMNLSV